MSDIQNQDLGSLVAALSQGDQRGAAVNAATTGVSTGIKTGLEQRKAALQQKIQEAGLLSPSDINAAQTGTAINEGENRSYSPEAVSALGNVRYSATRGKLFESQAGATTENANTKSQTEKDSTALKNRALDEKTAYDQGRLAASDAASRAKASPTAKLTQSSKSSAEFAGTLLPHIDEFEGLVHQAAQKNLIGPAAGRLNSQFLAGKIGSTGNPETDELLGQLKSEAMLLASGMTRMHFGARGGQQIVDKFSSLTDVNKLSEPLLRGDLKTMRTFAQGYRDLQPVPDSGNPPQTQPTSAQTSAGTPTPVAVYRRNAQGKLEKVQ